MTSCGSIWKTRAFALLMTLFSVSAAEPVAAAVDLNGRFLVTATLPFLGTFSFQWDVIQSGSVLSVTSFGGLGGTFVMTGTIDPNTGDFTLTDDAPFCATPGTGNPGTIVGTATSDDDFDGSWTSWYFDFPFFPCVEFTFPFTGVRSACGTPEELCAANNPCCQPTCDGFRPAGTVCPSDGMACSDDLCDGAGTCTHPATSAGAVCRVAQTICDAAEVCDGVSLACPPDGFLPAGVACPGYPSSGCAHHACSGGSGCLETPMPAGTLCRPAFQECSLAQFCDGVTVTCPIAAPRPAGAPCSADADPCTFDACNGVSFLCQHPAAPEGTPCDDGNPLTATVCRDSMCVNAALDAFKCYRVKDQKDPAFESTVVATTDQITVEPLELMKPTLLCTPVSLTGGSLVEPSAHLTCYKAKGQPLQPRPRVEVVTPLQQSRLELRRADLLCVPSEKTVLP